MKKLMTMCVVIAALAVPVMAGTTVFLGDIYTIDPTATSFGAVRFKDFTNMKDGKDAGNLYLSNTGSGLGSATNSDGRSRVQASPHWDAGKSHSFSFEYRPVAGSTDLILAQAANMATPAQRVIDDPAASVNFISFWIHNTPLNDSVSQDTIALTLTNLDGNILSPIILSVGSPGGDYNWYLTDPTVLANGFILSGSIDLTAGVDAGEADKISIAFGNVNVVPAPGAILLGGMGVSLVGWLRRRRSL